jgi:ribosomal protein S18 acetylase RimI-like enzyme
MDYLDRIMPEASQAKPQIERWTAGDGDPSLALALARIAPEDRPRHAAVWRAALVAGRAALWIVRQGERAIAAVLAELAAGRTAHLQSPELAPGEDERLRVRLLQAVCGDLAAAGVRVVQALQSVDHGAEVAALNEAGFRHANDLLYLVSLHGQFPTGAVADSLELVSYSDAEHARLAEIVLRTYAGSLDCPDLGNVRPIDEVLAGYRGAGKFNPAHWLIVRDEHRDVGCLLLTRHEGESQLELSYLGVVPEARGRGLGVQLVRIAQQLAGADGCQRVVTAVDAANGPAIAAYAAAGFVAWDRRSVYLRVL